jgi:hypothetical protein
MKSIKWLLFGLVMIVAASVRFWRLGEVNYWFDETFTLRLAQFPLPELIARSAQDNHPPFSFLLYKIWIAAFGTSHFATRLLSTVWSMGIVAVVFGFMAEAEAKKNSQTNSQASLIFAAVLAGMLVALSPLHVTWAQQARMYAPACFFAVCGTWLFWRALESPLRWWRWWAYIAITVTGLYTHTFVVLVFVSHMASLALMSVRSQQFGLGENRAALRNAWIAVSLAGLCWAPWFGVIFDQAQRVQADYWSRPLEWRFVGEELSRAFGVAEWKKPSAEAGVAVGQVLLLIVLGLIACGRRKSIIIALSASAPFAAVIAASLVGRNILAAKYFLFGQTLALGAASIVVLHLPTRVLRTVVAIGLIAGQGYLAWSYHSWRAEAATKPGMPELLRVWNDQRRRDEPLIFCNPMYYTTARVYAGENPPFYVYGDASLYPFFIGTAIIRPQEYFADVQMSQIASDALWTCDCGWSAKFMHPVPLSEPWSLVAETAIPEFDGLFYLRRYEKRATTVLETLDRGEQLPGPSGLNEEAVSAAKAANLQEYDG